MEEIRFDIPAEKVLLVKGISFTTNPINNSLMPDFIKPNIFENITMITPTGQHIIIYEQDRNITDIKNLYRRVEKNPLIDVRKEIVYMEFLMECETDEEVRKEMGAWLRVIKKIKSESTI